MSPATLEESRSSTGFTEELIAEWRPVKWRVVPGLKPALRSELNQLAALAPNWDGYGAPRISPAIIDAARQFVDRLPEQASSRPAVVPMSPGNLQLEWHEGDRVLELEFETADTIHYLKWDPADEVEEEDAFPATDMGRAVQLIQWFTKSE
jgi:hypothetical protein